MASHRASPPWRPEKAAAAAALAMAPAVWLAWLAYDGALGVRPVTEAIRFSGDWALRLFGSRCSSARPAASSVRRG